MIKVVSIRRRNVMLLFLFTLGIVFLVMGWSGMPQKLLKMERGVTPVASLAREPGGKNVPDGAGEQNPPAANTVEPLGGLAVQGGVHSDYFVDYRLERQRSRGQSVEYLREIIDNQSSAPEIRQQAQEAMMVMSNNISLEVELENLIKAKGFDDVVVSLREGGANVVVRSGQLAFEETARICDLVTRGTGITEQNIVIIPRD